MTDAAVARPRRTQQPEQGERANAQAAEPVAPATTPAPVSRPHMHDLWLDAGGGTDAYDADRYVGLLREHGWALPKKGLGEILATVLVGVVPADEDVESIAQALAPVLTDELGKHGYRIHDITRCVRPAGDPLLIGRPMTPAEEATMAIPRETPRRRRRRS